MVQRGGRWGGCGLWSLNTQKMIVVYFFIQKTLSLFINQLIINNNKKTKNKKQQTKQNMNNNTQPNIVNPNLNKLQNPTQIPLSCNPDKKSSQLQQSQNPIPQKQDKKIQLWEYLQKEMQQEHSNNSINSDKVEEKDQDLPALNHTSSILSLILPLDQLENTKCPECSRSFTIKSHLYRHIRQKHQQPQLCKCTWAGCNKQFKRRSHLTRHMITHTHIKKFKCLLCIMQFGHSHHLKRHIRFVHEQQKYKCGSCWRQFNKKNTLNKHIMDTHENKGNKNKKSKSKKSNQSQLLDNSEERGLEIATCGKLKKQEEDQCQQKLVYYSDQEQVNKKVEKNKFLHISEQMEQKLLHQQDNFQKQVKKQEQIEQNLNQQAMDTKKYKKIYKKNQKQSNQQSTYQKNHPSTQKQETVYRCPYSDCICAYKDRYKLKNHINKKHSNSANNQCEQISISLKNIEGKFLSLQ